MCLVFYQQYFFFLLPVVLSNKEYFYVNCISQIKHIRNKFTHKYLVITKLKQNKHKANTFLENLFLTTSMWNQKLKTMTTNFFLWQRHADPFLFKEGEIKSNRFEVAKLVVHIEVKLTFRWHEVCESHYKYSWAQINGWVGWKIYYEV